MTLARLTDKLVHHIDERDLGNADTVYTVLYIGVAQDRILHQRDTLHNRVDGLGALHRVVLIAQEQVHLELYEVCLVLIDIAAQLLSRVLARKTVGVFAIGQQEHLQVHAFREQHVGTLERGMQSSLIVVVDQRDVRREPVQDVNLLETQGRTRTGHHILYARLVHGDHIGLSLHQIHLVGLGNSLLGLIDAIQLVGLVVDVRVGRVHILHVHTLGARIEHTGGKPHHLAALSQPREYHPARIAVDELSAVVTVADARFEQEVGLITLGLRRGGQRLTVLQVVAQPELANDIIAEASAAQILHAIGLPLTPAVEQLLKIAGSPLVDDKHRLALALFPPLLVGHHPLPYLNMVFGGQPSQRFGIRHLLMLHDKGDRIAPLATTETMAGTTGRRNDKRGCLLVMKRTEPLVVGTALAQCHKLGYHIHYIGSVLDLLHRSPVYACICRRRHDLSSLYIHTNLLQSQDNAK